MSSQTETNTNNRTSSDISDKKVRKESSKKVPSKEVESSPFPMDEISSTLDKSYLEISSTQSLSQSNMSQSNQPTFSAVNSEKKIKKSKVSKKAIEPTDVSISQMTKPVPPSNWDEATQDEKDAYREQVALWKQFVAKQKKAKQEIQLEPPSDDDEEPVQKEEQPVQQEEVPVDASIEDDLERDQQQDDEEQVEVLTTAQFTASAILEPSVPFPTDPVEPLSALDFEEEETSKPSADEPKVVQFEEASAMEPQDEGQEKCMFCLGNLNDRKVSKCSFCSGHLCLGTCSDAIINEGGNNCPQCRKKYFRTEEEKFLDDMEAEEQERRRQFDLRRLEFLRQQKVKEELNRATEIRQRKLAENDAEIQEELARHQQRMAELLAKQQRLTCMTDAEVVADEVATISDASLITPQRRAAIAPMRPTTPSRQRATTPTRPRGTTPSRPRASSPTPSSTDGSRRGGSTAGRVKRTMASMDIRIGDEFELALPRVSNHTWRIVCSSIAGNGAFRVLSSSNRPEVVGTTFSTSLSPFNAVFQEYVFSVGIPKQDRTPWKILNKYRGGVCIGKQM
jgi:hypothetical protein